MSHFLSLVVGIFKNVQTGSSYKIFHNPTRVAAAHGIVCSPCMKTDRHRTALSTGLPSVPLSFSGHITNLFRMKTRRIPKQSLRGSPESLGFRVLFQSSLVTTVL